MMSDISNLQALYEENADESEDWSAHVFVLKNGHDIIDIMNRPKGQPVDDDGMIENNDFPLFTAGTSTRFHGYNPEEVLNLEFYKKYFDEYKQEPDRVPRFIMYKSVLYCLDSYIKSSDYIFNKARTTEDNVPLLLAYRVFTRRGPIDSSLLSPGFKTPGLATHFDSYLKSIAVKGPVHPKVSPDGSFPYHRILIRRLMMNPRESNKFQRKPSGQSFSNYIEFSWTHTDSSIHSNTSPVKKLYIQDDKSGTKVPRFANLRQVYEFVNGQDVYQDNHLLPFVYRDRLFEWIETYDEMRMFVNGSHDTWEKFHLSDLHEDVIGVEDDAATYYERQDKYHIMHGPAGGHGGSVLGRGDEANAGYGPLNRNNEGAYNIIDQYLAPHSIQPPDGPITESFKDSIKDVASSRENIAFERALVLDKISANVGIRLLNGYSGNDEDYDEGLVGEHLEGDIFKIKDDDKRAPEYIVYKNNYYQLQVTNFSEYMIVYRATTGMIATGDWSIDLIIFNIKRDRFDKLTHLLYWYKDHKEGVLELPAGIKINNKVTSKHVVYYRDAYELARDYKRLIDEPPPQILYGPAYRTKNSHGLLDEPDLYGDNMPNGMRSDRVVVPEIVERTHMLNYHPIHKTTQSHADPISSPTFFSKDISFSAREGEIGKGSYITLRFNPETDIPIMVLFVDQHVTIGRRPYYTKTKIPSSVISESSVNLFGIDEEYDDWVENLDTSILPTISTGNDIRELFDIDHYAGYDTSFTQVADNTWQAGALKREFVVYKGQLCLLTPVRKAIWRRGTEGPAAKASMIRIIGKITITPVVPHLKSPEERAKPRQKRGVDFIPMNHVKNDHIPMPDRLREYNIWFKKQPILVAHRHEFNNMTFLYKDKEIEGTLHPSKEGWDAPTNLSMENRYKGFRSDKGDKEIISDYINIKMYDPVNPQPYRHKDLLLKANMKHSTDFPVYNTIGQLRKHTYINIPQTFGLNLPGNDIYDNAQYLPTVPLLFKLEYSILTENDSVAITVHRGWRESDFYAENSLDEDDEPPEDYHHEIFIMCVWSSADKFTHMQASMLIEPEEEGGVNVPSHRYKLTQDVVDIVKKPKVLIILDNLAHENSRYNETNTSPYFHVGDDPLSLPATKSPHKDDWMRSSWANKKYYLIDIYTKDSKALAIVNNWIIALAFSEDSSTQRKLEIKLTQDLLRKVFTEAHKPDPLVIIAEAPKAESIITESTEEEEEELKKAAEEMRVVDPFDLVKVRTASDLLDIMELSPWERPRKISYKDKIYHNVDYTEDHIQGSSYISPDQMKDRLNVHREPFLHPIRNKMGGKGQPWPRLSQDLDDWEEHEYDYNSIQYVGSNNTSDWTHDYRDYIQAEFVLAGGVGYTNVLRLLLNGKETFHQISYNKIRDRSLFKSKEYKIKRRPELSQPIRPIGVQSLRSMGHDNPGWSTPTPYDIANSKPLPMSHAMASVHGVKYYGGLKNIARNIEDFKLFATMATLPEEHRDKWLEDNAIFSLIPPGRIMVTSDAMQHADKRLAIPKQSKVEGKHRFKGFVHNRDPHPLNQLWRANKLYAPQWDNMTRAGIHTDITITGTGTFQLLAYSTNKNPEKYIKFGFELGRENNNHHFNELKQNPEYLKIGRALFKEKGIKSYLYRHTSHAPFANGYEGYWGSTNLYLAINFTDSGELENIMIYGHVLASRHDVARRMKHVRDAREESTYNDITLPEAGYDSAIDFVFDQYPDLSKEDVKSQHKITIDELAAEWERQDVQLSKSETSEFKDLLETFQMLRRK